MNPKFEKMIKELQADGLIDENRNLTDAGHDYVEQVKRDLMRRQAEAKWNDDGDVNEVRECAEAA